MEFCHDAVVREVVIGEHVEGRVTYIRVKFVPCPVKTEDQGTIVVRFGNDFKVALSLGEIGWRFSKLPVGIEGVNGAG